MARRRRSGLSAVAVAIGQPPLIPNSYYRKYHQHKQEHPRPINGHVDVYNRCLTPDNCIALVNFSEIDQGVSQLSK